MKRGVNKELIGIFLFVLGFLSVISSDFGYTGAFIGVGVNTAFPFGIFFMLIGCALFAGGRRDSGLEEIAKKYKLKLKGLKKIVVLLKNNQIPDKPRDYISIANKCGYDVNGGKKEGYAVCLPGTNIRIQTIPGHGTIGREMGKNILKDLYDAEGKYSKSAGS